MKKIFLFYLILADLCSYSTSSYIKNYDNRLALFPNFFSYDNIKKESLYYALEGFYNLIGSQCAQTELRIGYNMVVGDNDYFCPYLCGGWLKSFKNDVIKNNFLNRANIFFGGLGLCYDHEILSIFHVGFRSELLIGSSIKKSTHCFTYGFEGRLPITFYFGHKGKYDFRLEPFAIFLSTNNGSSDLWGLIANFGYKF